MNVNKLKSFLLRFYVIRMMRRGLLRSKRKRIRGKGYTKVFCIGWLKTGTTSFGVAMRRIGFKHLGWDQDLWRNWYEKGKIEKLVAYARHFDSFDDLPWNMIDILPLLDEAYPNSKFVLLERNEEEWFESFKNHERKRGVEIASDKMLVKQKYYERNELVKSYFSDKKSDQLLVMNVMEGDGYEKLCAFLEVPRVNEPFPHANKRAGMAVLN